MREILFDDRLTVLLVLVIGTRAWWSMETNPKLKWWKSNVKSIDFISRLKPQKKILWACLLNLLIFTRVCIELFVSIDVSLCAYCHCFVPKLATLNRMCFFKHHVERSSYRHNIRCIVILTWDIVWIVDEAHTIKLKWYQPSVEDLLVRAVYPVTQMIRPD